jgi:PKD repeat protein
VHKTRVYGLTCVLILAAMAARGTTIVLPTDEQLIAKSPVIVDGTVLSTAAVGRDGSIVTDTRIEVARAVKGDAAGTITVRETGGIVGDRITKIFGTPEFTAGERVLLFLEPSPRGGYRTIDLYVGKFSEAKTADGRRLWLRDDTSGDVTLLDADLHPLAAKNIQRDAAAFETFVANRIGGRAGVKNYGIENPVLARDVSPALRPRLRSDFTMISEPTLYRWFRFDSGQAAAWVSSGTQPGYGDGGVSELKTAMGAWNGYASAKINYTYTGSRTGPMGGLDAANGANEVLFNDPLNEISGTWNRSTGGVVGTGGFNGVSGKQSWTAPFTADATHPAGTTNAWNIIEGNLTIQDAVSPQNGISSSRLAEIVAHEFGHTLGFGHSDDPNALMYYSVTGLGPSLRADDQNAARWLYPNGSGTTPPPPPTPTAPAAPTALTATASGSSIDLSWNDNANNESGQGIYLASGTGSFAKVTDVAANAESARLNGLAAGSYRIYVVAYNGAGISAQSNTGTATVSGAPSAAFALTPSAGVAGLTLFTFTDQSTGGVTSRVWSFGDGGTSTQANPTHIYPVSGQFTVTLTVSGGGSMSTATKLVSVSGPLNASFLYSPANPTTNDAVLFADQSTGAPTSWQWSFGDGTTSTAQNPAKRYAAPGNYTVSLTVMREGQSATGTRVITVSGAAPATPSISPAFDISTDAPAVGANVSFVDRSTGAPTKWVWSFGDGATATVQNPTHAYAAPGTYLVTMSASNASTSGTATKQIIVAAVTPFRTLVSVATQSPGIGGTAWRTELSVFNAGTQGATVSLVFLPTAGGSIVTRSLFLAPRQAMTYANVLLDLFGIGTAAGALGIEATSAGTSADLRVSSRTFTTGADGTYGQSVPDVQPDELERTLYITGLIANAAFRTNVGLVNRGGTAMNATLSLFDRSGATLSTKTIGIPANSFQQSSLAAYFPEVNGQTHDVLTMRISAPSSDAISGYCSVIDNISQDPIYIQAVPTATGGTLTLPIVGRAPGVNGTFWRSDVTLFNPNVNQVTLTLRYGSQTKAVLLGGGDTMVLADVLSQFGLTSGTGTLHVSWPTSTGPVVTSRTYTSVETGGTYGQSIDPVAAFGTRSFVPGLRNDTSFRSNVGFVNGGTETEFFTVTLLSPSGTELVRNTLTLAPGEQVQQSVTVLFPNVIFPAGFTLQAEGDGNAQLFAYGSMVDNGSGDPVFFAGR